MAHPSPEGAWDYLNVTLCQPQWLKFDEAGEGEGSEKTPRPLTYLYQGAPFNFVNQNAIIIRRSMYEQRRFHAAN